MKKLISLLIALLLCACFLSACDDPTPGRGEDDNRGDQVGFPIGEDPTKGDISWDLEE